MFKSLAVTFIFASVYSIHSSHGCRLRFTAAYGVTDGELISRSAASYGKTVRFFEVGQSVLWHFYIQTSCSIDVLNVIYSNDGPSDNLTVYINDRYIGSFQSVEHSKEGVYWNKLVQSGLIGKPIILNKGNHTLSLNISLVDIYGFETDEVILGAICDDGKCSVTITGHPDNDNDVQRQTTSPEGNKNYLNKSNVITLAVGVTSIVISIIIAIPTIIVAVWTIYKCVGNGLRQRLKKKFSMILLKEPLLEY